MYAAGVGLGHEDSKRGDALEVANALTRGGGGDSFADKTREGARRRWRDMS
jgi:hypothetical protein